jgi:DnaJ-class molecular chaperone
VMEARRKAMKYVGKKMALCPDFDNHGWRRDPEGRGKHVGPRGTNCPNCQGTGYIWIRFERTTCPHCEGAGHTEAGGTICSHCGGKGYEVKLGD